MIRVALQSVSLDSPGGGGGRAFTSIQKSPSVPFHPETWIYMVSPAGAGAAGMMELKSTSVPPS